MPVPTDATNANGFTAWPGAPGPHAAAPLGRPGDVLVDCDDVLVSWIDGFRAYASARLGYPLDPAGPDAWDMTDWLGLGSREAASRLIVDFNQGDMDYFGALPGLADAVEAIARIAAAGRGIHVVTSCSTTPHTQALRRRNLAAVFGEVFGEIVFLERDVSKAESLARFPRSIWVEDNHDNALAGLKAGHRPFILRRSHNRAKEAGCTNPALTWVDDWDPILAALDL